MVTLCKFSGSAAGDACEVCGYVLTDTTTVPVRRICGLDQPPHAPGLGDYTEQLLQSVGITKDRYQSAKQLFGFAPTCHCDQRKEWLNRVSDWWRAL